MNILSNRRSVVILRSLMILSIYPVLPWLVSAQEHQLPALEGPIFEGRIIETFQTQDARQAVAVDGVSFFAINNYSITRHEKETGAAILQWDGISETNGPLIHLDSGMVHDGRLYAAHSNYPNWPMTSSIEVWDASTLEHVATHSFGVLLGSMTWLDRHDGFWWAGFGNYDKVQDGQTEPYGETRNSKVVKLNDEFQILQQWLLPDSLQPRLTPMTNSGGSWGDDGHLYLTGHDRPEIYVMNIPRTGSKLDWLATVIVEGLNGQGIAWDRSIEAADSILWGILKQEELIFQIEMPKLNMEQKESSGVLRKLP